ncbi:hypothetical protein FWF74_03600 [Candidatus Saccharibacteria bacterium]|nr:hypothetical protein [Candidatus Saccharibacteria bacterium]MCL1962858.1 hypothetical protein [Candidatus Saccharibacteria bacterium]
MTVEKSVRIIDKYYKGGMEQYAQFTANVLDKPSTTHRLAGDQRTARDILESLPPSDKMSPETFRNSMNAMMSIARGAICESMGMRGSPSDIYPYINENCANVAGIAYTALNNCRPDLGA